MSDIRFTVPGNPISKYQARPGHKRTAEDVDRDLSTFLDAYRMVAGEREASPDGEFSIHAKFYLDPAHFRDVDNMLKYLLDCLTGRLYVDDRQVTEVYGRKCWADGDEPRTEIEIRQIGAANLFTVDCEHCGEPFRSYPSHQRDDRPRVKYCSKGCREAAPRRGRVDVVCDSCGIDFTKQRCHLKKYNYCSHDCLYRGTRQHFPKRPASTCGDCGGPVSRKEYKRCQACSYIARKAGSSGAPQAKEAA